MLVVGVMYDYFAAPSDEVAATVLDGGPSDFAPVQTKWLDPVVVMGKLEALLTGRAYADVVDDERSAQLLAMEGDGEVLVLTVTDGLRDGLHRATDLDHAAAAWAEAAELSGWAPQQLAGVLGELQELAKKAVSKGERLYCWVCV
jgi:hypothetical protein